jgi:hypothetical protein
MKEIGELLNKELSDYDSQADFFILILLFAQVCFRDNGIPSRSHLGPNFLRKGGISEAYLQTLFVSENDKINCLDSRENEDCSLHRSDAPIF